MKRSFASLSLFLFGLSVVFLVLLTMFESTLAGLSATAERISTISLLVLPAGFGVVLGALSLARKEEKPGLGIAGIVLNAVFVLFHLMIVLFAG